MSLFVRKRIIDVYYDKDVTELTIVGAQFVF